MAWANAVGLNFRETVGHATDGTNQAFVGDIEFPTNLTVGGVTLECGYAVGKHPSGTRDRGGTDPRFRGQHYWGNGSGEAIFRVTLEAAGEHVFRGAFGDTDYSDVAHEHSLREGSTAFHTFSTETDIDAAKYWDMGTGGENALTESQWIASNNAKTHTTSGTDLRIYIGRGAGGGGNSHITHINIAQSAGAATAQSRLAMLGAG